MLFLLLLWWWWLWWSQLSYACFLLSVGYCRYGAKCQFAHGSQDLRPVVRHRKYKTEKCKNFEKNGVCPYGPRCRFIHNEESLSRNTPFVSPFIGSQPSPLSLPSAGSPTLAPPLLALQPPSIASKSTPSSVTLPSSYYCHLSNVQQKAQPPLTSSIFPSVVSGHSRNDSPVHAEEQWLPTDRQNAEYAFSPTEDPCLRRPSVTGGEWLSDDREPGEMSFPQPLALASATMPPVFRMGSGQSSESSPSSGRSEGQSPAPSNASECLAAPSPSAASSTVTLFSASSTDTFSSLSLSDCPPSRASSSQASLGEGESLGGVCAEPGALLLPGSASMSPNSADVSMLSTLGSSACQSPAAFPTYSHFPASASSATRTLTLVASKSPVIHPRCSAPVIIPARSRAGKQNQQTELVARASAPSRRSSSFDASFSPRVRPRTKSVGSPFFSPFQPSTSGWAGGLSTSPVMSPPFGPTKPGISIADLKDGDDEGSGRRKRLPIFQVLCEEIVSGSTA